MRGTWPAAVLLTGALALSACSAGDPQGTDVPPPVVTSTPAPGPSGTATSVEPEGSTAPAADGLTKGTARHVVRSGGLTVTVDYATPTPVSWSADDGTSLQVSVSARDATSGRKVYLSKATLRFAADDGATSLEVPDPITDTANIDPGFLVTQPNQYVQVFSVPTIDRAAQDLTLTVKLEFVTLVDKKDEDYTKRTVTDSLRTVVA